MDVDIDLEYGYPVTVNDQRLRRVFTRRCAHSLVVTSAVMTLPNPVMGAEDFSYVLNTLPGAMMFLGATPQGENPLPLRQIIQIVSCLMKTR
jgi:metal-dependent amidase/aminoacylase/carboxypeptidase family protein